MKPNFIKISLNNIVNILPSREIIPEINQTNRLRPTEPDLSRTPFGDTKIPDPKVLKM